MELLLLFKHPVILKKKESTSKSCKNKGNIQSQQWWREHYCVCRYLPQHKLAFIRWSASVEVHVYGCISDPTVPAFLFIGSNCVCQHDRHCWGSGMHHSLHSVETSNHIHAHQVLIFLSVASTSDIWRPRYVLVFNLVFGHACFWLIS